ncbi:hypothetical protein AT1219_11001 [Vibrio alginolyticus]
MLRISLITLELIRPSFNINMHLKKHILTERHLAVLSRIEIKKEEKL